MEKIETPFTPEQVKVMNEFQKNGRFHPFTGTGTRAKRLPRKLKKKLLKTERGKELYMMKMTDHRSNCPDKECLLIATEKGFVCPCGKYTQKWAWAMMADQNSVRPFVGRESFWESGKGFWEDK